MLLLIIAVSLVIPLMDVHFLAWSDASSVMKTLSGTVIVGEPTMVTESTDLSGHQYQQVQDHTGIALYWLIVAFWSVGALVVLSYKLFKLFKAGDVNFKIGYDQLSDTVTQTKVAFETENVSITSIISCDDGLLSSVPADAIRGRASKVYPYAITLNKDDMMQLINRLSLFATGELAKSRPYGKFEFNEDSVTVYDLDMRNNEQVFYETGELELNYPVSLYLDLADFKATIEGFSEDSTISLSFGDGEAVVVTRGNIRNVIPEVRIS